jgi:hypothetical protein
LKLKNQGSIHDYLNIKLRKTKEGQIELTQLHLIESILIELELFDEKGKAKDKTST